MKDSEPSKLTTRSLLSFEMVMILFGFAVWIVRLSEKVERHEKFMERTGPRLYSIEEFVKMNHPPTLLERGPAKGD